MKTTTPCRDGTGRAGGYGAAAGPRFKLRVLRLRCIDCAGSTQQATRCDQKDCPLWDHRKGHRPKGYKARRTPLRALRAHCLDCCDGQAKEVRLCPAFLCPLWPWRSGRSATGEIARPLVGTPLPEAKKRRRRSRFPGRAPTDGLWHRFEQRVAELASRLGISGLTAEIPQRWLPKVHTFVSMRCPHWHGGWCKREGLPDDVKARAECPLKAWNAEKGMDRCRRPPCPAEVARSGLGCSGCDVQQTEPCQWLERNLLAGAPREAVLDYAARTLAAVGTAGTEAIRNSASACAPGARSTPGTPS